MSVVAFLSQRPRTPSAALPCKVNDTAEFDHWYTFWNNGLKYFSTLKSEHCKVRQEHLQALSITIAMSRYVHISSSHYHLHFITHSLNASKIACLCNSLLLVDLSYGKAQINCLVVWQTLQMVFCLGDYSVWSRNKLTQDLTVAVMPHARLLASTKFIIESSRRHFMCECCVQKCDIVIHCDFWMIMYSEIGAKFKINWEVYQ